MKSLFELIDAYIDQKILEARDDYYFRWVDLNRAKLELKEHLDKIGNPIEKPKSLKPMEDTKGDYKTSDLYSGN